MKKYLSSVALCMAIGLSASAQVSLGVKGGVNFSKINADNVSESTVAGYQAGIFGRFGTGVYLQPEVYLSSKGGKFNVNNNGTDYSGNVKFTTLNVPLLIGTAIGDDSFNFRLMGGPIYSYAISKSQSFGDNFAGAYNDFGKYNNSTLGFQVGGGVDIGPVTADLRYEGGLTKVNDNYGQRQNLWALSVGFKFF